MDKTDIKKREEVDHIQLPKSAGKMFYNRLLAKISVMFLKCLGEMKAVKSLERSPSKGNYSSTVKINYLRNYKRLYSCLILVFCWILKVLTKAIHNR